MRRSAALLMLLLAACSTASVERQDVSAGTGTTIGGDRTAGAEVFSANCATCHGEGGRGGSVGPSLYGESQRMDYGGLVSWIEAPEPPMPKLYPQFLTPAQVRDAAAYVESL
jgi:mono/diheme cytochrome c family protein